MRTNVEIDNEVLEELRRRTGIRTKREVVDMALRKALQIERQKDIRALRGRLNWDGDLDAMRRDK